MDLPTLLALACGVVVAAMNVVATTRLARAPMYSRGQKIAQSFLLWLIPVLGLALVWHFMNEMAPPRVTTDLRTWLDSGAAAGGGTGVAGGGPYPGHHSGGDSGSGHSGGYDSGGDSCGGQD